MKEPHTFKISRHGAGIMLALTYFKHTHIYIFEWCVIRYGLRKILKS